MAMTPEMWQEVLRDTPTLYHVTDPERLPAIMRDGLRSGQPMGGIPARPGYVYLWVNEQDALEGAEWFLGMEGAIVLQIDARQLDPNLVEADEDYLSDHPRGFQELYGGPEPPEGGDEFGIEPGSPWAVNHPNLDRPDVTWGSYKEHRTIAYGGTVPPSAIVKTESMNEMIDRGVTGLDPRSRGFRGGPESFPGYKRSTPIIREVEDSEFWVTAGNLDEEWTQVPPAPGTTPIPDGYVRLFHGSTAAPEELRKGGIDIGKAKGMNYGEPNVVWASADPGHVDHYYNAPSVVEFAVPYDDPRMDIGSYMEGINYNYPGEAKYGPQAYAENLVKKKAHVTFRDSINPEEFLAIHEPWHRHFRYFQENNLDPAELQWLKTQPPEQFQHERRALEEYERHLNRGKLAAISPYQYEFVPLTDYELGLFRNLPPVTKQQWYERAKRLNTRARKLGEEGLVGAKELFGLLMRHENKCMYCDKPLSWTERGGPSPQHSDDPSAGTWDHNIPLSEGGENTAANLVPACWHCNKELNFQSLRQQIPPHPQKWEDNPLLDTPQPQPVTASAKVKCPNCGLEATTEVCENCGKPLGPEWVKLEQGSGEAGWDGPRLPTHQQQNEFLSDPQRVDKTNWDKTDNSFPSMIS